MQQKKLLGTTTLYKIWDWITSFFRKKEEEKYYDDLDKVSFIKISAKKKPCLLYREDYQHFLEERRKKLSDRQIAALIFGDISDEELEKEELEGATLYFEDVPEKQKLEKEFLPSEPKQSPHSIAKIWKDGEAIN